MADPDSDAPEGLRMQRRSPLAGHATRLAAVEQRSGGSLRVAELAFTTKLDLRLDPEVDAAVRTQLETALGVGLPRRPNTATRTGDVHVLWLGPDEWLVLGPADDGALARTLAGAPAVAGMPAVPTAPTGAAESVVNVSAANTVLSVAGSRARDLLSHGCALDLHPQVFGIGDCAQTRLSLADVLLFAPDRKAVDHRGDPVFWVVVRSSFAGYLADWLLDAAVEYLG